MKVEDLYNGMRRFDSTLAAELEPYLPLDDGAEKHPKGDQNTFGSISFEFFSNLMEEANIASGKDCIGSAVDLDSVATEVRIVCDGATKAVHRLY